MSWRHGLAQPSYLSGRFILSARCADNYGCVSDQAKQENLGVANRESYPYPVHSEKSRTMHRPWQLQCVGGESFRLLDGICAPVDVSMHLKVDRQSRPSGPSWPRSASLKTTQTVPTTWSRTLATGDLGQTISAPANVKRDDAPQLADVRVHMLSAVFDAMSAHDAKAGERMRKLCPAILENVCTKTRARA